MLIACFSIQNDTKSHLITQCSGGSTAGSIFGMLCLLVMSPTTFVKQSIFPDSLKIDLIAGVPCSAGVCCFFNLARLAIFSELLHKLIQDLLIYNLLVYRDVCY